MYVQSHRILLITNIVIYNKIFPLAYLSKTYIGTKDIHFIKSEISNLYLLYMFQKTMWQKV